MQDLVIGIDSSTQSTKAIAWDRTGHAIAEGRAPIPADQPAPNWMEQDPRAWWSSTQSALREVAAQIDTSRVAGLAISNQRETVGFFGADGAALHPAILWLDGRSTEEVAVVTEALGADWVHATTGKPADVTPVLYTLAWMRRHRPDVLDQTHRLLDVHGYLTWQLTGQATASWTSADPFGILDIEARAWSDRIFDYLGLSADQLGTLAAPGALVGHVTDAAASATGLRAGTPVFAAGGDGQCAGLGVNAARPGVIYLNLGTALITGAWSPDPAICADWRTLTSPTGQGYFLEGCQRAGTFLVDWFVDTFAGGRDTPGIFERLEREAALIPIGAEGAVALPYLSGAMDPYWDAEARAGFLGLGPQHKVAHLYRAVLEAHAVETARCVTAMRDRGLAPAEIIAVGGGAQNALWLRMFADATGLPVRTSTSLEASALGAGISAAQGVGWFADFDTAAAQMSRVGAPLQPQLDAAPAWAALAERRAAAYRPGF